MREAPSRDLGRDTGQPHWSFRAKRQERRRASLVHESPSHRSHLGQADTASCRHTPGPHLLARLGVICALSARKLGGKGPVTPL